MIQPRSSPSMDINEKPEPGSVNVSEKGATSDDAVDNSSLLVTQTRTRRLFSLPQLFSFSFVYMATWFCVAT